MIPRPPLVKVTTATATLTRPPACLLLWWPVQNNQEYLDQRARRREEEANAPKKAKRRRHQQRVPEHKHHRGAVREVGVFCLVHSALPCLASTGLTCSYLPLPCCSLVQRMKKEEKKSSKINYDSLKVCAHACVRVCVGKIYLCR